MKRGRKYLFQIDTFARVICSGEENDTRGVELVESPVLSAGKSGIILDESRHYEFL
jgi:hypothetical protein